MTSAKRRQVKLRKCVTEGCEEKAANENMKVCAKCFQRIYDRWSEVLFPFS